MHIPFFTLLILIISLASSSSAEVASVFMFDRGAILKGEIWRILTCHFVHFSNLHLLYNLFAFGIAGWILETRNNRRFGLLGFLMALFISISLFIFEPDMWFYGGLSGMACGAIYYFALWGATENKSLRIMCILVILFVPIKISAEICCSASVLPYSGKQPFVLVPISHVVGTLVAVLFYAAEKSKSALVAFSCSQGSTTR